MNVNTSCYLAIFKDFRKKYTQAHFEVVTRTAKSCLSPSRKLLNYAKENNIPFEEYKELFLKELGNNWIAKEKLKTLRRISEDRIVFLVCYEKDAEKCHRSILREILYKPNLYGFDLK